MIQLRDYQQAMMGDVRAMYANGVRSVLMVAPTGSGKTVCFSWLAQQVAAKGKRVAILAHRTELVDQIADTLAAFGITCGFIAAGRPNQSDAPVQVASVQTLANRLPWTAAPDLVVIDEAHHAIGVSTWGKVLKAWPGAYRLGVTATPQRLSGEGLRDTFDAMVLGPSVGTLIEAGSLSRYRIFAPPIGEALSGVKIVAGDYARNALAEAMGKRSIVGDAVEHYARLAAGKRAVVFCVNLKHMEAVRQRFADAGHTAACIDGRMDRMTRKALVRDFSSGRIKVLVSCDVISEGFDLPAIEVAILMRPTQSLALYLQQVGRALRPYPGKDHALILDHAGNAQHHGFPDDDRDWSLDGRKKRKGSAREDSISVVICSSCFAANVAGETVCVSCGAVLPKPKTRAAAEVSGELVELERVKEAERKKRAAIQSKRDQWEAQDLDRLIALAVQRGYRYPLAWARNVLHARLSKRAGRARG